MVEHSFHLVAIHQAGEAMSVPASNRSGLVTTLNSCEQLWHACRSKAQRWWQPDEDGHGCTTLLLSSSTAECRGHCCTLEAI
jgi:hypothetical protein